MIDPDSLRAFVAVAELKHFVRAADRLGVSQPMISKRLQRLEDQLATRLIERGRRNSVELTRAGELFLSSAREALASLDHATWVGRQIARGEIGPIRVGYVFSAIMTGLLTRMLRGLDTRFPGIEIQPSFLETPAQIAAIAAGRIDFGIARPRPTYPSGVSATTIHSEGVMLALSAGAPLAQSTIVDVRDLAGMRFIVPQFHEEVGMIEVIRGVARAGRFEMPEILRTADFLTAAGLAAAGLGVAAVPHSLHKLDLDGLIYREIGGHIAALELVLLHRADAPPVARDAILHTFGQG